jgi:hypothetical protein
MAFLILHGILDLQCVGESLVLDGMEVAGLSPYFFPPLSLTPTLEPRLPTFPNARKDGECLVCLAFILLDRVEGALIAFPIALGW